MIIYLFIYFTHFHSLLIVGTLACQLLGAMEVLIEDFKIPLPRQLSYNHSHRKLYLFKAYI